MLIRPAWSSVVAVLLVLTVLQTGVGATVPGPATDRPATAPGVAGVAPASAGGVATPDATTSLTLAAVPRSPVVGATVSLRVSGASTARLDWGFSARPAGSDATLFAHAGGTATFRPDRPGRYVVTATPSTAEPGTDAARASLAVTVADDGSLARLRRYAPVLRVPAAEPYVPTRFASLVEHARLGRAGEPVTTRPTVFDLANRSAAWHLSLRGDPADYPTYDDRLPVTVYGSVHPNVTLDGGRYTAYTYWLLYVYDPKHPDTLSAALAHQYDVETATVFVNRTGPRVVGVSQHFGGERREFAKAPHRDTHVVVSPAFGSHAVFLQDTDRDGGPIPMQWQFLDRGSTDTRLVDVTEGTVDSGAYRDVTGNDTGYSHDGSVGDPYQLVVLTGREPWATYRGALGPPGTDATVPTRRARWAAPGEWVARRLPPDETQLDARLGRTRVTARSATAVELAATVRNTGSKPHRYHLVATAVPADGTVPTDDSSDTGSVGGTDDGVRVGTRTVPVGAKRTATRPITVSLSGLPAGTWDLRLTVSAYRPAVAEPEDVLAERTAVAGLVVGRPRLGPFTAADPDGDRRYEDVTGDGRVDGRDALVLFVALGTVPGTDAAVAFDLTGDGRVDVRDVLAVLAESRS